MSDLSFSHSFPPVTLEYLEKKQEENKIQLPQCYVDFLLKINGGWPDKTYFLMNDDEPIVIEYFYGTHEDANPEEDDDVFIHYSSSAYKEVFEIAYNDSEHCPIVISLKKESYGKVYNFFNDIDCPNPDESSMEYLFPDFQALLNSAEFYFVSDSPYLPIRKNQFAKAQQLIQKGSLQLNEKIDDFYYPIDIAFENNLIDMCNFLYGARENICLKFKFAKTIEAINFLLDIGKPFETDSDALHASILHANLATFEKLIALGANINWRDKMYGLPLDLAIQERNKLKNKSLLMTDEPLQLENLNQMIQHLQELGAKRTA